MLHKPYPRDPESLSKELSATFKVKDITEYYRLKDRLQFRWWDFFFLALLFIGGLGFIVTAIYLLPPKNFELYMRFLAFWAIMLAFAVIALLEILVAKMKALHRMVSYHARFIEGMQRQLRELQLQTPPSAPAKEKEEGNENSRG